MCRASAATRPVSNCATVKSVVEPRGLEPLTPCLQTQPDAVVRRRLRVWCCVRCHLIAPVGCVVAVLVAVLQDCRDATQIRQIVGARCHSQLDVGPRWTTHEPGGSHGSRDHAHQAFRRVRPRAHCALPMAQHQQWRVRLQRQASDGCMSRLPRIERMWGVELREPKSVSFVPPMASPTSARMPTANGRITFLHCRTSSVNAVQPAHIGEHGVVARGRAPRSVVGRGLAAPGEGARRLRAGVGGRQGEGGVRGAGGGRPEPGRPASQLRHQLPRPSGSAQPLRARVSR